MEKKVNKNSLDMNKISLTITCMRKNIFDSNGYSYLIFPFKSMKNFRNGKENL